MLKDIVFDLLFLSEDNDSFCMAHRGGGGMIMYMDGFRRTMNQKSSCLNLFFPTWTLNSRGKFMWALIGVFWLSFAAEGISKLRRRVVLVARKAHQTTPSQEEGNNNTVTFLWASPNVLRLVVTILHGIQAWMGYMLMLAVMTFSVELFVAVVLGLAFGYAVLFRHEEALTELHVTSNPCCNFMEGEARELRGEVESEQDYMEDRGDNQNNNIDDASTPLLAGNNHPMGSLSTREASDGEP